MEKNRYAKVELAGSNETKPAKVLHAKLSIGTSPEYSKFEGKKCKGSVLKKGRFWLKSVKQNNTFLYYSVIIVLLLNKLQLS